MNAELFIHGPRHAFYGKQDEASYSTLFDDSSIKDEVRFIVEIRKNTDNKWYTYYNYCRYGNVCDIDGRNGAYIGISLRLDAYYTNLRAVFTILDAIFCKAAVGLLVQKVPSGFQYMVNNFESSKSQILEKIEKPIGVSLLQILSTQDVVPIDGSFKTDGKPNLHGIDDIQFKERRLAEMRATGKIIFASSVPTEQLQACIEKNDRDKQAFIDSKKQEIARLESSLTSASNEINVLREKLSHSETECKSLSGETSRLKQEFSSSEKQFNLLKEKNKNLENKLRSIAEILSSEKVEQKQLNSPQKSENIHNNTNTNTNTNTDGNKREHFHTKLIKFTLEKKYIVKLIGIFIVIFVLLAALFCLKNGINPLVDKNGNKANDTTSVINSTKK